MDIWQLFDEDSPQPRYQASSVAASGKSLTSPPEKRGKCGLAGLANLGTTCYLNSLVQTLYFTPGFRERLFALTPEELGMGSPTKARNIPIQLQRLFARLARLDQQAMSLADLTASFGWERAQEVQQHDVQELNRVLFSAIEQSLVGTKGQHIIRDLYAGEMVNIIQCLECGMTKERPEAFHDITVPVADLSSLQQGLAKFTEMEHLAGDNKYRCDSCDKLSEAYKGILFRQLPPILTISLNRFTYDWERGTRNKITGKYEFPTTLNMKPYCMHNEGSPDFMDYELYSVVIHRGAAHGGHYHSYIRDLRGEGTWTRPEPEGDGKKKDSQQDEASLDHQGPVELIHSILMRITSDKNPSTDVTTLCKHIDDQTGQSWNRMHKKTCGPIRKFMQSLPEVFSITDEIVALTPLARVSLEEAYKARPSATEVEPAAAASGVLTNADKHDAVAADAAGEAKMAAFEPGKNWFDLNDSSVSCIPASAIQAQFSGQESAYMLFYIKKEHLAAAGGAPLLLPDHLAKEVQEANEALAAARATYDEEANRIDVYVSVAADFLVQSSTIVPLDPSQVTPENPCVRHKFTVDQRMPFEDFRALVISTLAEKIADPPSTIFHTFLPVGPGAWHVFARIEAPNLKEGKVASVADAGVKQGTSIMAWNGSDIAGDKVQPGSEHEPLVLSIHKITNNPPGTPKQPSQEAKDQALPAAAPSDDVVVVSLPKSAPLGQLKALLAEKLGVAVEKLLVHQMDRVQENAWGKQTKIPVAPLLADLDAQSLQALGITSLTKLTVEEVTAEQSKAKMKDMTLRAAEAFDRISRALRLCVVYAKAGTTPLEVDCEKSDKISDFKSRVISLLVPQSSSSQNDAATFRLRLQTDDTQGAGLGVLLADESKTLGEAGAVTNALVTLEEGALPADTQVVLRIGLGLKAREYLSKLAAPKEGETQEVNLAAIYPDRASLLRHQEIVVPRSTKVEELLTIACNKMQLREEWHLNLTNWCGELADALRDLTATVEGLKLTHNYLLLLERGAILPKGYITLKVWVDLESLCLASVRDDTAALVEKFRTLGVTLRVDEKAEELAKSDAATAASKDELLVLSNKELVTDPLVEVGEMQIKQGATIPQLKEALMTMKVFAENAGSPDCLRVRENIGGRMYRRLRPLNTGTTLKHLKVFNNSQIAVTILPTPDPVSEHALLLNVTRRVPALLNCVGMNRIVLDDGPVPTFGALKQYLAGFFGIPLEHVAIAKHNPRKGVWKVLEEVAVDEWKPVTPKKKGGGNPGGRRKGKAQQQQQQQQQQQAQPETPKVGLFSAPYSLTDGDLLAVKDLQDDPERKDDFMTDYDRDLAAIFEGEVMSKRADRSSRKANNPEWYGHVEVALAINVPDFAFEESDEEGEDPAAGEDS